MSRKRQSTRTRGGSSLAGLDPARILEALDELPRARRDRVTSDAINRLRQQARRNRQ